MEKKPAGQLRPKSLREQMFGDRHPLLAAGVTAVFATSPALAQDDEEIALDTLQIEERTIDTNPYAEKGAPYKAKVSGDERRVKPLAETPTTISVLTKTQIEESGREDLREILAGQPGITLGTGENGNAFGDRYIIRGHEARSDVFVDGLRDPGMTTRESFAVDQIEITKGPSSTFAGRGSTGGAVNSVTKQASSQYDFTKVNAGVGTDSYYRVTLDANKKINDAIALRANVLFADQDVPDRAPASRERSGLALSGAWEANEKIKFVADYYYLNAEDKPDLGTYIDRTTGEPVDDVPVYLQDEDFLKSEINVATLRANFNFSESMRLTNVLRSGTTENGYVVTGTRTGNRHETDPVAPGAAAITPSTHQGWQEVEYLVNQTNFYLDVADHQLLIGFEYSDLNVTNGVYSVTDTGEGNCILPPGRGQSEAGPGFCLTDPNGNAVDNINNLLVRDIVRGDYDSDYNVKTTSLSVMDTYDVTDKFSVFAGVRMDSFDYDNATIGFGATEPTDWSYSDTLWNGHLGLVFDVTEQGNVYVTYSTATNINGGESDVGGNCGYGGLCGSADQVENSKPESVENIELGTKWNLRDEKLLFTAALFQITKSDVMEGADYESTGTFNTGENRVQGVEFSLVGNLTEKLSTQFGVAFMDAEITESFNNGVNQTLVTRGPNAGTYQTTDDIRGRTLSNFADNSAFLQLRYQMTEALALGGSWTYSSEMYSGQPDTAPEWNAATNDYSIRIPDYSYFDLFATYDINAQTNVRLNIGNVTDEAYYLAAYRSGSFTYIGDARHATLTFGFEF